MIEIAMFAVAHVVLIAMWGERVGALVGTELDTAGDWFYYSAMVYSTVGFGDIVPNPCCVRGAFRADLDHLVGFVHLPDHAAAMATGPWLGGGIVIAPE